MGTRPRPVAPVEITARTHPVVVPPQADRPGFTFLGPGPAEPPASGSPVPDQTLARVLLADGMVLLVVCFGRTGTTVDGWTVRPAEQMVASARAAIEPPAQAVGPVDVVDNALGRCWRLTRHLGGPRMLTDTYVDHAGSTFAVGVLSSGSQHALAVEVLDRILTTWRWLPASTPPAG